MRTLTTPQVEPATDEQYRRASRLELLRACEQAGIRLRGGTPKEANYGFIDPRGDYRVLSYNLDLIFTLRDAGKLPWGGRRSEQEAWAKGGIATDRQTLQAILDYHRAHGHVPDPERFWWLRCSTLYVCGHSFYVSWTPTVGLDVRFTSLGYWGENGACLSQEAPDLGGL